MNNLAKAFKELRKNGFLARMNFSCCQSCASVDLEDVGNVGQYVFFHKQDAEQRKAGVGFYLAFGNLQNDKLDTEAGQDICDMLEKFGVEYQWNGRATTRILIRPNQ